MGKSRKKSKSRSRKLFTLKKGSLIKYGYSVHSSAKIRHNALNNAIKEYGYSTLIKKINAIRILSKNKSPKNSNIYTRDIKYLQNKYKF